MIDPRLAKIIRCPRDQSALRETADGLECAKGHAYPVVEGIPILLVSEDAGENPLVRRSLDRIGRGETTSLPAASGGAIDPYVQQEIVNTNGNLYRPLIGKLTRYPIPDIQLPDGSGKLLLDVGCNWGRWCAAASRKGYAAVGIDPMLDAVLAARRVARDLGVDPLFVVGDARRLPFDDGTFDVAHSYSVLQHFSEPDARAALAEMGRVLLPGGLASVQLANRMGLRNTYMRARRGFRAPRGFEVRYWSPRAMRDAAASAIGPAELRVDGFFSLNPRPTDRDLLPRRYRAVVDTSMALTRAASGFRPLGAFADSLFVEARKRPATLGVGEAA